MAETSKTFELIEPVTAEDLLPGPLVAPWMISGAVAVACFAVALVLWLKKRGSGSLDPLARRKLAYSEATSSLASATATDARGAAVHVSLILRRYLALAASDPALFETHEEFIGRHGALVSLTDEARSAASAGFDTLARLKYAPEAPEVPPETVLADGRTLLETLHHGFKE